MAFYKKTIPLHTSKKENPSSKSEPNNSEDIQTSANNDTISSIPNPIISSKRGSFLGGIIHKAQASFEDRKTFYGKAGSLTEHLWFEPYYEKFKTNPDFAITHIISDDGSVPIIQIANGEVKAYSIQDNDFLPGASQWLSNTNYDYTPPKEKDKASKDAKQQSKSTADNCIDITSPDGLNVRVAWTGGKTERQKGSDR